MKYRLDRISRLYLNEDRLLREGEDKDEAYQIIFDPDNWEVNEYGNFLDSVDRTPDKYKGFMTPHPEEELSQPEWKTFKLKGLDAGFALHYTGKGKVDICNLHNNSELRGISDMMLTFAKQQGGSTLDNYAGFLGDKYQENGFDMFGGDEWDEQYRPEGWRDDLFGHPNVEYRSLTSHDNRYNDDEEYRRDFDDRMDKQFPGHTISESQLVRMIKESIENYLLI